ncbi:MAG: tetratricopeptide repeat protein [Chitinophagaceae bacterium]
MSFPIIGNPVKTLHRQCKVFCLVLLFLFSYSAVFSQQAQWALTLEKTESLAKAEPDSAYVVLKELMTQAQEKKDPLTEGICLQQIGLVFYNYSNYTQAVDHLLQAEKIFRELKASDRLAKNLNYLGEVYYSNKQPQLAAKQFNEALQLNTHLKNYAGVAFTYGNIGHLYEKRFIYDSAYMYQQKALQLYHQAKDSMGMAKIFENMGSIFEDQGRLDSATVYFEKALYINQQFNDEIAQIEILNNLGDALRKKGDYNGGMAFTRKALALATKKQSQSQLASANRDMAKGFELLGVFDSAYYYNEHARKLVQQIYSASNNRQIALLETIYDVEKKNNEIEQLALDKKIDTIIAVATIAVVILLVILGAVVISRQRLKIKNEKELNEQNKHIYEKNRELMQVELKNKELEEDKLRSSLEVRSRELSAHTLHIIQKNQLLEELRNALNEMAEDDSRNQKKQIKQLTQKISLSFNQDTYWDEFRVIFDQVHQTFFTNLKQHADNLTPAELRLVALLRMNLSSGDMATLLGISQDSLRVARYRLRKKLNIGEGESLTAFIQGL